jgi:hypothetical protein
MAPVVVLLFGQFFVSGYLLVSSASRLAFCCCADSFGFEGALATAIAPRPLGSESVIVSLSLATTAHPVGTGTVSPSFDAVGPWGPVGEAMGLGDPAGVGLGTSAVMPPLTLTLLPKRAIAVPQPAMITTRPTTAAMIITHGVRCTGACGAAPTGE